MQQKKNQEAKTHNRVAWLQCQRYADQRLEKQPCADDPIQKAKKLESQTPKLCDPSARCKNQNRNTRRKFRSSHEFPSCCLGIKREVRSTPRLCMQVNEERPIRNRYESM